MRFLRACSAITVLVIAVCLVRTHGQVSAPDLRGFVQKHGYRQAYGLYMQNRKVGWMVDELRLRSVNGAEVAVQAEEFHIRATFQGEQLTMSGRGEKVYSLSGDGPILRVMDESDENRKKTTHIGVLADGQFRIASNVDGRKSSRDVRPPREDLRTSQRIMQWLVSKPRPGANITVSSVDLERDAIDVPMVMTYRGRKSMAWGGVSVQVHAVRFRVDGVDADMELRDEGIPIRGTLGGLFVIRAEEEETAKRMTGPSVDLLAATAVPAKGRLGDPERVERLDLKITGAAGFAFPQSHRQQVKEASGTIVLSLRRDFRVNTGAPLKPEAKAKYVAAAVAMPISDPEVIKIRDKVLGPERDPLKAADQLRRWVFTSLRKSMAANSDSALDVLKTRAGDCTEHALLFTCLARSAGIPSRVVGGVVYAPGDRPMFAWHAWAEIHDGRQWVTVDPTWNQLYVDATHVKLSEGLDNFAWVNLLGRMKFAIIRSQSRKKQVVGEAVAGPSHAQPGDGYRVSL
jgi:hypothetical protein